MTDGHSTQVQLQSFAWRGPVKERVKEIYEAAFVAEERVPFISLQRSALGSRGAFLAAVDAGEVVGFVVTQVRRDGVYVMYLAVDPKYQGKGYGSAILTALKHRYVGNGMTLGLQAVDPRFPNYQQRIARRRFYERNGFHDSGWRLRESCGVYELFSYQMEPSLRSYRISRRLIEPFAGKLETKRVPVVATDEIAAAAQV